MRCSVMLTRCRSHNPPGSPVKAPALQMWRSGSLSSERAPAGVAS